MRFLVVGAGSWGTAFSRVLLERGHEVVLACRTREQAEAIAAGLPTAAVIASEDGFLASQLQHALNSGLFRAYVNPDLVGVELCAAAKNVIALAAGAVDGLGLGDNAKASLISRGLAEMTRLGEAAGAKPETFSGLAGMGGPIVTRFLGYRRNRRAGEPIARGRT